MGVEIFLDINLLQPGNHPPGILLANTRVFLMSSCQYPTTHLPAAAIQSRGLQRRQGPFLTYSAICCAVRFQALSGLNSVFLTCIEDNMEGAAAVIPLECCDDCPVERLQVRCGDGG